MKWLKLTVLVFLLGAIQCNPMSNDELEDFQNFLKRTSQLDQTIRKGVDPDDDEDEDQAVSDHAWEESGKFEGDLILNDRQRRVIVQDVAEGLSRNGLKDSTKRWPNNEVIYYIQKDHFSGAQVEAIQNGINDLEQASCVKFRPYQKGDRDAVVIQGSRRGCFSQVGYQSGYQVLNLSGRHPVGRGCFRHGTVVHELLHTLGFYHMQSSPDRDDYIDVIWENIRKPARHNFRKYNAFSVSDFGVGYDYDSVLHYSRRAFSTNGQDTLVPKKGGAEIGQRVGLSDKDTQKLNKMYCDADSDNNSDDDDTTDDTTSKPVKKKKPKNKPFEGHGIGYHQGKTVVIKLLPAPETYKLPDVPSFHVFDYFSKAPQALSSTSEIEGFRTGKEMIYPYHLPTTVNTEEYSKPQLVTVNTEREDWTNDEKISSIKSISSEGMRQLKQGIENITSEDWHNNEKSKYESSSTNGRNETSSLPTLKDHITNTAKEFSPDGKKTEISSENMDVDLSDAFDSLAKIIKSHVYPSHTPNLNIFKAHKAHLEASNPDKSKVDEALLDHNEKVKSGMEMITEMYDRSSMVASNADYNKENKNIEKTHSDGDGDSHSPRIHSYENYPYKTYSFSVNGPYKENDYVAPEYATDDDEVNDNYRDLDYYKEDNKSKKGPKRLPDDLRYKWYGEDTYYHKPSYGPALANLRSTVQTPYTLKIIPYHSKYDIDEAYSSSSDKHVIHSLFGYPDSPDHTWLEAD